MDNFLKVKSFWVFKRKYLIIKKILFEVIKNMKF